MGPNITINIHGYTAALYIKNNKVCIGSCSSFSLNDDCFKYAEFFTVVTESFEYLKQFTNSHSSRS